MAATDMPILCRQPGALCVYPAAAQSGSRPQQRFEGVTSYVVSSDGATLYAATADDVSVFSMKTFQKVMSVPEPGVVLLALSPAAGYLVTCQKPSKGENNEPNKNLKVWKLADGSCVMGHSLKTVSKDSWPVVSWADDDTCFAIAVTNGAQVYNSTDNFARFNKVGVKSMASLSLCPAQTPFGRHVACFIPEAKGSPASVGLYDATVNGEANAKVRKAFYRTQSARLLWNSKGTSLLVLSYTDFDVTNQSYYGEQKLHYLPTDPSKADSATTVALPKEGPVHDVQWSPTGDYFLTVAGFMPAKVTLWDANCKPIFDFGSGPYSLARWNPFGRFIAIAGFGNLPGDILFFDKLQSGTCKQMGATRCPAVSAEWSPDGRHLLVATTAPRLRVDNKTQVLSYTGQLLHTNQFEILFEASWVPAAEGTFPNRAPSPERLAAAKSGSTSAAGGVAAPAAKPAGYVPPHLRNGNAVPGSGADAPRFSLAYDPSDKGGKIASKPGSAQSKASVPGFEVVESKSASKNAKRRAKKKSTSEKGGDDGDDGDEQQGSPSPSGGGSSAQLAQQVGKMSVSGQQGGAEDAAAAAAADPAKRLRNLQKKLTQIQQLKEKAAKEGQGALNAEQIQKLQSEADLVKEIKELGGTV